MIIESILPNPIHSPFQSVSLSICQSKDSRAIGCEAAGVSSREQTVFYPGSRRISGIKYLSQSCGSLAQWTLYFSSYSCDSNVLNNKYTRRRRYRRIIGFVILDERLKGMVDKTLVYRGTNVGIMRGLKIKLIIVVFPIIHQY